MHSYGFISEESTRGCMGIINYFLLTAFASFFSSCNIFVFPQIEKTLEGRLYLDSLENME